jgi:hypothetical protein
VIKVLVGVGGLGAVLVILAGVLIATGDPSACVDRRSAASAGALQSLSEKWTVFKAARPGSSVNFTEQETTSRGVAYLQERDVPIKDLQVYFCADGKAEAKGRVTVLGRDVSVLLRGSLDVSGGQNRVVIDSVQAGNLPSWIGTSIINRLLDRNDVRTLPLGVTLTSSVSTDGLHTLGK